MYPISDLEIVFRHCFFCLDTWLPVFFDPGTSNELNELLTRSIRKGCW